MRTMEALTIRLAVAPQGHPVVESHLRYAGQGSNLRLPLIGRLLCH